MKQLLSFLSPASLRGDGPFDADLSWRKLFKIAWCEALTLPTWLLVLTPLALHAQHSQHTETVLVDIAPSHVTNSIVPREALGSGIDRIPIEAIDKGLTKETLDRVFAAGWQPVTYRQNTELAVEAWHWNPEGTWSDPSGKGYFTGSATSSGFIRHSFGYGLPHRGVTRNDGTGTVGFSRITDGDEGTYWKSNPYLTSRFTGEDDALHPQWVIVDLANDELIDTLKIAWAEPFAKQYLIQYWTGTDPIHKQTQGAWITFAGGEIAQAKGGTVVHRLAQSAVRARFVRIWMTQSSNTCDTHESDLHGSALQSTADPRSCAGYAIRELYVGTTSKDGTFHDLARHTADQEQTATYCSSVDPWHTSDSQVNTKEAQVGFDLFYGSGVTRGLPAMMPIAMIYDTPDNAAAEIKYLENHKYPISNVEMGEEADGQYMLPEDYAALYLQYARVVHGVDPKLKIGGPSFEGVNEDIEVWPDSNGKTSWLGRFLDYLKAHGRMQELQFFSFEHYPFDPCRISWATLYEEPRLMAHIMEVWHNDGLPAQMPMFITESNLSSATSETYMDIFGGLWLSDYIGSFLTAGGNGVYYFHYLPLKMERGCNDSAGTFGMFAVDAGYKITQPLSQFYAAQMINREWLQMDGGAHRVFPATADVDDGAGHPLITAYVVQRPDQQWSVMIVNKDQETSHRVGIAFEDRGAGKRTYFAGQVDEAIFGRAQYAWRPAYRNFNAHLPGEIDTPANIYIDGGAGPDGPILTRRIPAQEDSQYELPAASIVVLRGKLAGR